MPRAGLNRRLVVEEAARLADEVGLANVTLAALAGRLGVTIPSLYKHVRGLDHVRQQVAALAAAELADDLAAAAVGLSGGDALRALAAAVRGYARRHPGRYPAAQLAPDPADPDHRAAADRAVATIGAALRGYGLTGDDAIDAIRTLRAGLHGFLLLESGGGFGLPQDVDRSFDALVAGLDRALASWPAGG